MNKVPNIISTKDLSFISDMLSHNVFTCKKVNELNNLVEDKDVEKVLDDAAEVLKNNYNILLNMLN